MNGESKQSGWGIGIGLGISALAGILVTAIVGMLRIAAKNDSNTERGRQPAGAAEFSPPKRTDHPSAQNKNAQPQLESDPSPDRSTSVALKKTETTWQPGTKYFVSGVLVAAIAWLLYISSKSITTIIFAILLTFIVHPVTLFVQRKLKMRYGTATALTYLLVLLIIILLPFLLIPSIIEAFGFLGQVDFTEVFANISAWLSQQAAAVASIPVIGASLSAAMTELASMLNGTSPQAMEAIAIDYTQLGGRIAQTLKFLASVFGPLISMATSVVFALLISLHINLSIDMIDKGVKSLIPDPYEEEIMNLIYRLIGIWRSFLRGQMVLMVVVGVIVWIGNAILGTPQALFLGFLAGLLEVIPNLGPILATIPAIILALLFGSQTSFLGLNQLDPWVFTLIIIGFYILVQITENQLLVPYILGDAVDLPPMVVLSGVLIGGSAFGIVGVLLASPMISSGREIFNYVYDKILEEPQKPPSSEKKQSFMDTFLRYVKKIPVPRPFRSRQNDKPDNTNLGDPGKPQEQT